MNELCTKHISADSLSRWLEKDRKLKLKDYDEDWFWLGVRVLWERWHPEIPNLEMLDDKMQDGYVLLSENKIVDALKVWGETWNDIKRVMDNHGFLDIKSFDNAFGGTQSIYNWSSDYYLELENVIRDHPEFAQTIIDFCTEYIERYKNDTEHNIKNMQRAIAETYFCSC